MAWLQSRYCLTVLPLIIAVAGCKQSSDKVNLGEKEISIGSPVQLRARGIPVACSRDGRRLLCVSGENQDKLTVSDVDGNNTYRTLKYKKGDGGPWLFNLDGSGIYYAHEGILCLWHYRSGSITRIRERKGPDFDMTRSRFNLDRSIVVDTEHDRSDHLSVFTAGGESYDIAHAEKSGFDSRGSLWILSAGTWQRIDAAGRRVVEATAPAVLNENQSRNRGTMHLLDTQTEMKYNDGTAFVSCIWLTDDRAQPHKSSGSDASAQDAVVFVGADVYAYGFLPGHDKIFVVTGTQSVLVPYRLKPSSAD